MIPEDQGRLMYAYRDGTLAAEEAVRLDEALRAGGEDAVRIRRELELAGLLGQVFDGADDAAFLRSFEERMRAESGKSQFVRAFEAKSAEAGAGRARRAGPRLARRLFAPASPAPWLGAAAVVLFGLGLVVLLGRGPARKPPAASSPGAVAVAPAPESPVPSDVPTGRPEVGDAPSAPRHAEDPPSKPSGARPPVPAVAQRPPDEAGPVSPPDTPPSPSLPETPPPGPAVARAPERPPEPPDVPVPPPVAAPTVPRPRADETPVAVLDRFQGEVVVVGADGQAPARQKRPLLSGQTVQVIGRGAADLRFPDGTRVEVQGDAAVAFPAAPDAVARLEVKEGRVLADVARQPAGKPFVFATAEAEAVVLGTRLAVTAIPGLTRLDVYQGRVRLDRRQDGAVVTVGAGQYAIAEKGRPMEAIGPVAVVPRRPGAAAVASFTLINADTDQPVSGFDPLIDGAVLHLDRLPTRNLNVRANTVPAQVGSVQIALDGRPFKNAEWRVPYALYGDSVKGDYAAWAPAPGEHVLTATPYEKPDAKGEAGQAHAITFYVIGRSR